jgi:hypothetical protein
MRRALLPSQEAEEGWGQKQYESRKQMLFASRGLDQMSRLRERDLFPSLRAAELAPLLRMMTGVKAGKGSACDRPAIMAIGGRKRRAITRLQGGGLCSFYALKCGRRGCSRVVYTTS